MRINVSRFYVYARRVFCLFCTLAAREFDGGDQRDILRVYEMEEEKKNRNALSSLRGKSYSLTNTTFVSVQTFPAVCIYVHVLYISRDAGRIRAKSVFCMVMFETRFCQTARGKVTTIALTDQKFFSVFFLFYFISYNIFIYLFIENRSSQRNCSVKKGEK